MSVKRIISFFLCVLLLMTSAVPSVCAKEAESESVTFLFVNGETIRPFFDLPVADGSAEAYGLTPAETDHTGKKVETATVLDALVCAHAAAYGDCFTAQSAQTYLSVSYGFASKVFSVSGSFGFALNDTVPHDDVLVSSDWGTYYTGYAMDTTRIENGDVIVLYTYTDTDNWMDLYPSFAQKTVQTAVGESFTVNVSGYSMMMYGCSEQSVIDKNTVPMAGAQLRLTQDFESYTPVGALDGSGSASLSVAQEGTWYLVVGGNVNGQPVVSNICTVCVGGEEDNGKSDARWFPVLVLPVVRWADHTLTLGFSVRLRDLNRQAQDCRRVYALQFCFDGSHPWLSVLCEEK